MISDAYRRFYNDHAPERWGRTEMPEQSAVTASWLDRLGISPHARVVELGCGRGLLASAHPGWIGLDFSLPALRAAGDDPRLQGDMQSLPFGDETIDVVVSWAAIEHVPRPELVLEEIERVLRPAGIALLAPAWHVRPWAASGIATRAWRELSAAERITRLTIPVRESLAWRALAELPHRLANELRVTSGRPVPFRYRRLEPNLDRYVQTDSDAFTAMDPHAMLVYFVSRRWIALSHPTPYARITTRHDAVVVQKPGSP